MASTAARTKNRGKEWSLLVPRWRAELRTAAVDWLERAGLESHRSQTAA